MMKSENHFMTVFVFNRDLIKLTTKIHKTGWVRVTRTKIHSSTYLLSTIPMVDVIRTYEITDA